MRQIVIDTSFWTAKMDWHKAVAAGAAAMYTKASQKEADPTFAKFWKDAKGVLPRGAFHYMDWHLSALASVNLFTGTMAADWGELPPALDLEQDPTLFGLSQDAVRGRVTDFLQSLEKATGIIPMIYCGFSFWQYWMTPDPAWLKYPFWLAWYESESFINAYSAKHNGVNGVPKPWTNWAMWQFTGNGPGPQYGSQGLSLDMSWCENLDAIRSTNSEPTPPYHPPPAPPPNDWVVTPIRINVRSGPTVFSKWVRYAVQNEVLHMTGVTSWGYSEIVGGGWVFTGYIKRAA